MMSDVVFVFVFPLQDYMLDSNNMKGVEVNGTCMLKISSTQILPFVEDGYTMHFSQRIAEENILHALKYGYYGPGDPHQTKFYRRLIP